MVAEKTGGSIRRLDNWIATFVDTGEKAIEHPVRRTPPIPWRQVAEWLGLVVVLAIVVFALVRLLGAFTTHWDRQSMR